VNKETYDNQLITDYLLGVLSETETERFDEMSFTDDEFAERLRAVENELVDAYVRGELHGKTLERFKSFYLSSPGRREKVEFAQTFQKMAGVAVSAQPQQTVRRPAIFGRPMPGWLPLAAAALLLLAVGWLAVQDMRLGQRAAELQLQSGKQAEAAAEQQKQIDELRNTIARLEPRLPLSEPQIVPFVLEPQTRGISRAAAISVPAGTDFVTFQLELEGETPTSYQAALRRASETISSRTGLKAQRRDGTSVVVVTVRAALLNPGDYLWELSGQAPGRTQEIIGSYVFRVLNN
jgi:hypothetical protein